MAKYCVQIYGKVPEEMEIEAEDADDAIDKAVTAVMYELEFEAKSEAEPEGKWGRKRRPASTEARGK